MTFFLLGTGFFCFFDLMGSLFQFSGLAFFQLIVHCLHPAHGTICGEYGEDQPEKGTCPGQRIKDKTGQKKHYPLQSGKQVIDHCRQGKKYQKRQ